ncbi:P63C domain-containing protein [Acidocella sp.]|uniref:P63C domain-containing protein n=1 Tax=Acidocella sp. TaxID=50710 RepID=UPI0026123630|nr:P63C domain-containing protein [Acidocella sp.]
MPPEDKSIKPIPDTLENVAHALLGMDKNKKQKTALYIGSIPIGEIEFDCAVLEDGTRVLSERAVHRAFGSKRGGSHWRRIKAGQDGANMPSFLSANNYFPFVSNELASALMSPIAYSAAGGTSANGIKAELLPEICGVFLAARRAGKLHPSQEHLANQAEVLMEAFAKVGIVALVDEATGYQRDRAHDALRLLLSKYIAEGLQKWLKTFPDAFFKELDRLYDNDTTAPRNRPQYYGKFINKYVYEPIEHGYVKAELNRLNIDEQGRRRARFHQWLSGEGRNMLIHQIGRVQGLMEMCSDIENFKSVSRKQRAISIAPYMFDDMNRIIE